MRILRMKDLPGKVGLSKGMLFKMISDNKFPKPFSLTPGTKAWVESDIDKWIEERRAGSQPVNQ